MKKTLIVILSFLVVQMSMAQQKGIPPASVRKAIDTVGYATTASQMDSIVARITREHGPAMTKIFEQHEITEETLWKVAICPHDDYAYAGKVYPLSLYNIQAKTVILFGVCHKAKPLGLSDNIVFDGFSHWQGPYGKVKVSPLRDEIIKEMPAGITQVNDSAHQGEHSLEALIPFLQYYNADIEIIPILISPMSPSKMEVMGQLLAQSIKIVADRHYMNWGPELAFVISTDAVHYGDTAWGTKPFSPFGVDKMGYLKASARDRDVVGQFLEGDIRPEKLKGLSAFLVEDTGQGHWTWCGRYSVPFGLWTAWHLQQLLGLNLTGSVVNYTTSIDGSPLSVRDIKMGVTAPASLRHWVGYTAIGFP